MSIQQKILQYQGLTDFETFIVDELPTSKYFKVFSLEDTIPGGRSTFQILGSEFLEDNVQLKIELLDINGNPIYTEPIKYFGDDPSRHIMIEVYPETPAGVGKLTILGSIIDVPDDWKGLYNVKWEKDVFIDPIAKNTQPILFRGQGIDLVRNERYPSPELEIIESVSGVVVASGSSGNEFVTSSVFTGGTYDGNASPFGRPSDIRDLRGSPIEESFGESGHRGFTPSDEGTRGLGGGQTAKTSYAAKQKNQQNATDTTAVQTDIVNQKYEELHQPQAEPTPPPTPQLPLTTTTLAEKAPVVETKTKKQDIQTKTTLIKRKDGEKFRLELAGGTFKAEPVVSDLVNGIKGQNFQSSSFTASIVAVHSPDLLEIDTPFVIKDETPEKDDSNPFIAVPHTGSGFTIDFEPATTGSVSETILQSFANITIKNMKTFSGDVHRVKVFAKGFSTQGDFKLVADKLVEGSDVLVDSGSVSLSQKVGKFINQDHVDKNWEVKHIKRGPNSEAPELEGTATFTSSLNPPLMNAVLVSGSNSKVDESILFETKTPKVKIRPNVDYTLFVNAVVKTAKTDVLQADGSVLGNQSKAKVRFYLSGSNLGQDLKDVKPASSGSISNILGDPVKVVQTDDETQGQVISLESNDNTIGKTIDFGRVKIPFKPQFSGSGVTINDDTKLQVEVEAGELFIQSIELEPSSDTNFNPDEFTFQVPMPKLRKRPDFFDFLVEFYDRNGNKAGYTTIKEAVEFDGENDVIQGTDNLLTGSLSIGNAIGKGIEAAGVDSAFIRSVGYVGFTSASSQGSGGFMMFSGSVLPDSPDSYEGVGLEIHDGNSGSFKFRTHNEDGVGEFDVRTNKFFFGKEGVQFVSGSDDKIEISSSNFHLQSDGNLTIGGGAVINSSLSANSILVPSNASNPFEASASISSTGAARFTSASIGGFSVSETAISSSNGELVLKSNGQITGSNFKLDGGTISSGVTIDAAVEANSLSLPAVGTKTAVITAEGAATFSKAEIGSFKISTQEIRSLSGSLILSASGAITASDILATGNITANAGQVFQDVTNLHATSGALETDISSSISRSINIEETTGSLLTSASLIRLSLTSSKEESDLVAKDFGAKAVLSASAFAQGAEATASALAQGAETSASVQVTESIEFTREQTGSLIDFSQGAVVSGAAVAKEFGQGAEASGALFGQGAETSASLLAGGAFTSSSVVLAQVSNSFGLATGSFNTRFNKVGQDSASLILRADDIERTTGSLNAETSSIRTVFDGVAVNTASILAATQSLKNATQSLFTQLDSVSSSFGLATASIKTIVTESFTLNSSSVDFASSGSQIKSLVFSSESIDRLETSASIVSASSVISALNFSSESIVRADTSASIVSASAVIKAQNITDEGIAPIKTDVTQSKFEVGTLQVEATQSIRELGTLQIQATQSLDASSSFAGKFITSASILRDNLGGVESSASFLASGAIVSSSTDATSSISVLNTLTSASIATSASFVSASSVIKAQDITDAGISPIKTDVTQSRGELTSLQAETTTSLNKLGGITTASGSFLGAIGARSASMDATISASFTLSSASLALSGSILSGSIGVKINPYETQVSLSGDGLAIRKEDETLLAKYGEKTELFAGGNTSNKAILDTDGLAIVQNNVTRSFFGSSITIGKTTGNNTSRVEIASDAVNIINRDSGGNESTVLSFDKTGDVVSDNFLLERTRLFGAGGDGDIVLLSNTATVATGSGVVGSGKVDNTLSVDSNSMIVNEQGTRVLTRTGSVWSLEGDLYANNLTLDDATGTDITLITSGSRIFVKNELSIHGGCVIHNNGQDGDDGNDSATSDNSTSDNPTQGGSGGFGRALAGGTDGVNGSRGGNPDGSSPPGQGGTLFGGNGGGGGGSGGIVFISARFIVNSGSITANGGDGGDGGDGTGAPTVASNLQAADGSAGAAGSVINIKV